MSKVWVTISEVEEHTPLCATHLVTHTQLHSGYLLGRSHTASKLMHTHSVLKLSCSTQRSGCRSAVRQRCSCGTTHCGYSNERDTLRWKHRAVGDEHTTSSTQRIALMSVGDGIRGRGAHSTSPHSVMLVTLSIPSSALVPHPQCTDYLL